MKRIPPEVEQAFDLYVLVFIALGLIGFVLFTNKKLKASLKRKIWPPFNVAVALIMLGYLWRVNTMLPSYALYIAVPAVLVITSLNIRATRFCDSCGATQNVLGSATKPPQCKKCHSPLAP